MKRDTTEETEKSQKTGDFFIVDDSQDWKYFTVIPNYIFDNFSETAQCLYANMKRFAGKGNTCFVGDQYLWEKLKLGKVRFREAIKELTDKEAISFVGLHPGKTRPRKAYKINNIWEQNILFFEKNSDKKIVPGVALSSNNEKDSGRGGNKIVARINRSEHKQLEHNIILSKDSSNDINFLIDLFKRVNPSYQRLFGNRSQRSCLQRLLDKFGKDPLEKIILSLEKTNLMEYCPIITTPSELEQKVGKLIAFVNRENNKLPQVVTI